MSNGVPATDPVSPSQAGQQASQVTHVNVTTPGGRPYLNVGVAIILTFFFGPLGMLYSTVAGAVIMFFVSIVVGVLTLGFGLILTWPICMIWAAIAANQRNQRLAAGMAS